MSVVFGENVDVCKFKDLSWNILLKFYISGTIVDRIFLGNLMVRRFEIQWDQCILKLHNINFVNDVYMIVIFGVAEF